MLLTKLQRNQIYEAIERQLNPAVFDLDDISDKVTIRHNSGATFEFSRLSAFKMLFATKNLERYKYRANVPGGANETGNERDIDNIIDTRIPRWLNGIRLTIEVPDYWAEMQRTREFVVYIQRADAGNAPFAQNERRQIVAQLEAIKENAKEQFDLTSEQIARIGERLDEAAEAAGRMGRKDWLLLFGGTILNLIVTDTVTPDVAGHIFRTVIHGLIHLFGGGPPQILA